MDHAGRGGEARGTSKREDVLDTVIQLKRPDDYEADEGARFEVHLTKARGVFGDDARPFEAKLEVRNGRDHWTCTTMSASAVDRIAQLTAAGASVRTIAGTLGLSKSAVARAQGACAARGGCDAGGWGRLACKLPCKLQNGISLAGK